MAARRGSISPMSLKSAEPRSLDVLVGEAIDAFSRSGSVENYFRGDIDELTERQRQWSAARSRVGLIGITSAGKSTLINAMFGEPLLPCGVPPSSNCLVVCRRGARTEATLHFEEADPESITSGISEQLQCVADERFNPRNELDVKQVDLESPAFMLDPGITLVDTPGLDAHGLDHHEALTMKLFLPTVDMVVFATTAKANSDAQIKQRMDRIVAEGKPVLMVQTMIDSVEPKLGFGGEVVEDKAEVAAKHRLRLEKLVSDYVSESGEAPEVYQVSAHHALKGRLDESGLPELSKGIGERLERLKPAIDLGRRRQLRDVLTRVLGSQKELVDPSQTAAALDEESEKLAEIGPRLNRLAQDVDGQLGGHTVATRNWAQNFARKLQGINNKSVAGVQNLQLELQQWQRAVPASFEEVLDDARARIESIASELDMRPEDYTLSKAKPRHQKRAVKARTNTRRWTERKKKPGVGAFFRRLLGMKSGHDVEHHVEKTVDAALFREHAREATLYEAEWAELASQAIAASVDSAVERVCDRLRGRLEALEAKRDSVIEARERVDVIQRIGDLVSEVQESISSAEPDRSSTAAGYSPGLDGWAYVSVPAHVPLLLGLGHRIRARGFAQARETVLRRGGGRPRRVVVWSWDADSLDRFVTRFWEGVVPTDVRPENGAVTVQNRGGIDELTLVDESANDVRAIPRWSRAASARAPESMFVMLDVVQSGATRSELERSALHQRITAKTRVVIVVQSIQALLNTETLAEGLREAVDMTRMLGGRCTGMLVNDPRLSYTVLGDRLLREGGQLRTQADEMEWKQAIDGLVPAGGEVSRQLARALTGWVRLNRAVDDLAGMGR